MMSLLVEPFTTARAVPPVMITGFDLVTVPSVEFLIGLEILTLLLVAPPVSATGIPLNRMQGQRLADGRGETPTCPRWSLCSWTR